MNHLTDIFSLEKRPVSFRVNTLKSSHEEIEEALKKASITYTKLDFPKNSYVLDSEFNESDIWKRRVYKDGKLYMQWLSSQIPALLFTKSSSSPLRILDACAAPGWKTSQISALYPDAEIIAFEPFKVRYEKMQHNLEKLWCNNTQAINDEIRNIWKYIEEENYFDMILVDAPCSSEGSISLHNTKFLEAWDIKHINKNYKRQKYILSDVIPYLKVWWELIYTTCTIAPEENEAVVHFALCNYTELELQNVDFLWNKYIKISKSLKKFENKIFKTEISEKTIRVIPSEYSEWFYISKFIKWLEK